jgi:hypothetical protein
MIRYDHESEWWRGYEDAVNGLPRRTSRWFYGEGYTQGLADTLTDSDWTQS